MTNLNNDYVLWSPVGSSVPDASTASGPLMGVGHGVISVNDDNVPMYGMVVGGWTSELLFGEGLEEVVAGGGGEGVILLQRTKRHTTGGKDGAPREMRPVRTVANRIERCVKGVKSVLSFNEPGSQCGECELCEYEC